MTQQQLVQGCCRGDRAARRALYDMTSQRVYRVLLRMMRDPQDAADAMQETYLRAFEHIHQFRSGADIGTWVYRIAVNEGLQLLRKRRRRDALQTMQALRSAPSGDGQLQIELRDALDQLPEDERTLLILKYYEGMNYAEMAEILEKPAGTIASGLNRARQMLRQVLAGQEAQPAKI